MEGPARRIEQRRGGRLRQEPVIGPFPQVNEVRFEDIVTVVGWVFFLFCGFGLMSRGGAMPVIALAVGAISVAAAVLMILDLSNPYLGAFRASPAPLEQVLAVMGKE
jgi:hypothetical protein